MPKGFETDRDSSLSVRIAAEDGLATLISLIALSVFSLLACYVVMNATTEVRISDNYESEVQASFAARAGLNHAREVIRGLAHDDLLRGPNGTADTAEADARAVSFRNAVGWNLARALDVVSPVLSDGITDDGIVSSGKNHMTGSSGVILIPGIGISQTAPNPYGSGTIVTSRYFVKVSDNNGEATELAADSADNPYIDGDGLIIVRSIGIAQTIREGSGTSLRRNSVAAVEARFHSRHTFDLDAPFVIEGDAILPSGPQMFNGVTFSIDGGTTNPGIAVIDTDTDPHKVPSILPATEISSQVMDTRSGRQSSCITGVGGSPSILDITSTIARDDDKMLLKDAAFLYKFVTEMVPQFANGVYGSPTEITRWAGGSLPAGVDLGSCNPGNDNNDTSQQPRVNVVNGDLEVGGTLSGCGLLVVHGKLGGNGRFTWDGLILVIGAGEVDLGGLNIGITGGMFVANVQQTPSGPIFGTPKFTIGGRSNIAIDSDALDLAIRQIPADQVSWREIKSVTDP